MADSVRIIVGPDTKFIEACDFSDGFPGLDRNRAMNIDKNTLVSFTKNNDRVILAVSAKQSIVGYAVLGRPAPKSPWGRINLASILEFRAVETARNYRRKGLARRILTVLFSWPELEKVIVFLCAYSWTWDLAAASLTPADYSKMLICFYSDFGFVTYDTNEFNICLKPENFFMARVGKRVSENSCDAFKCLRFGLTIDQNLSGRFSGCKKA